MRDLLLSALAHLGQRALLAVEAAALGALSLADRLRGGAR